MNRDKINEVIDKTAKETGTDATKVKKIVDNLFCFLRNSMAKLEFKQYYIPKFGNFEIIAKRYTKYLEKHNILGTSETEEDKQPKKRNLKANSYVKDNKNNDTTTN